VSRSYLFNKVIAIALLKRATSKTDPSAWKQRPGRRNRAFSPLAPLYQTRIVRIVLRLLSFPSSPGYPRERFSPSLRADHPIRLCRSGPWLNRPAGTRGSGCLGFWVRTGEKTKETTRSYYMASRRGLGDWLGRLCPECVTSNTQWESNTRNTHVQCCVGMQY
jgi:hypothetical protein